MATVVSSVWTGNGDIDGLHYGTRWSGTLTYSFPTSRPNYYDAADVTGYTAVSSQQREAVRGIFNTSYGSVTSFTNLTVVESANVTTGEIQIFQADAIYGDDIGTAAVVNFPQIGATGDTGDVVFDTFNSGGSARNPVRGDYYYHQHMHELGHALGLKHSQDPSYGSGVAVSYSYDSMEYTVMSYRSYAGGPLDGYSNDQFGYAQTFMALDIQALQHLYGADYTTNAGSNVYTWNTATGQMSIDGVGQWIPGSNRVFMTVWDGGGDDWYNLSNYAGGVVADLRPGQSVYLSGNQLADLGDGHYARGNVYNSFLYNGDSRSYIENAIGGAGADTLTGNAVANKLYGKAGNDSVQGLEGDDTLNGGAGSDTLNGNSGNDTLDLSLDGASGGYYGTYVDLAGNVAIDGFKSVDTLREIENIVGTEYWYPGSAAYSDLLIGSSASNTIDGRGGHDYINGADGSDYILGGGGNDLVFGGAGNDVLIAGAGNDYLVGGAGADCFCVIAGYDVRVGEIDIIGDFEVGKDYLYVSSSLKGTVGVIDHGANYVLMYGYSASGNWYQWITGTGVTAASVSTSIYYA